jgi:hypothetical protein
MFMLRVCLCVRACACVYVCVVCECVCVCACHVRPVCMRDSYCLCTFPEGVDCANV